MKTETEILTVISKLANPADYFAAGAITDTGITVQYIEHGGIPLALVTPRRALIREYLELLTAQYS